MSNTLVYVTLLMPSQTQNYTSMDTVSILSSIEVSDNDRDGEVFGSSLIIDHSLRIPEIKPILIELVKDLFKHWSHIDESHFSAKEISGGYTNRLLKVSVEEENGNMVHLVVRLFGPNTEDVIDRDRELRAIQQLSIKGFGPKLLGTFQNGTVQSFIDARTLTLSDVRKPILIAQIAKLLNSFHKVDVPGSKEPELWDGMLIFVYILRPANASNLTFDDSEKQKKYEQISFEEIHVEINKLKELTGYLHSPVVFAHNDLHYENLMFNDDEEKLYFIDFEFSSYNYRGFDIGNHFNEYDGLDCDDTLYPTKDERYHFFRHYLNPEKPNEVSDNDLEALYVETSCYMLASHLKWSLWALIQANMSMTEFNYLDYFFIRYNEFKKQKNKCFSLAKSYLSRSSTT